MKRVEVEFAAARAKEGCRARVIARVRGRKESTESGGIAGDDVKYARAKERPMRQRARESLRKPEKGRETDMATRMIENEVGWEASMS